MGNYAEVIFETGSKSVVNYETEDELKSFLKEHTRRALAGEAGGPTGHPAERVSKVLLYGDTHPAESYEDGMVDAAAITALVEGMSKDGKLNVWQLIEAARDEASPLYPQDQGRHESIYKAEEVSSLDLGFLNSSEGGEV